MSKNFLEKLTERLLLLLKKFWKKLVRMVRVEKYSDEEKEMAKKLRKNHSSLEVFELIEQVGKNEIRRIGSWWWSPLLLLIFIVSYFITDWITEKFVSNWSWLWFFVLLPLLLFSLGEWIIFANGKTSSHQGKFITIGILYIITMYNHFALKIDYISLIETKQYILLIDPISKILILLIVLLIIYYFIRDFMRNAIQAEVPDFNNIDFFLYKSKYEIVKIIDILGALILTIEKVNNNETIFETENGFVLDLGKYLRLIICVKKNYLLSTVLSGKGRFYVVDTLSKEINEKVDFIFREILKLSKQKDNKINQEMKEHCIVFFNEYTKRSEFGEMITIYAKKSYDYIFLIVFLGIGIISLFFAPENVSAFILQFWILLTPIILYMLFEKKLKKS